MENKTYKARVEVSLILEIGVEACHEDNAAAISEDIAEDIVKELVSTVEYGGNGDYVANYGVKCIEVYGGI